jgi:hypothetical protein
MLLFIVARHRPDLFDSLKQQFAREEEAGRVQVLLDRRQEPQGHQDQARERERRHPSDINNQLRTLGCAIVREQER